MRVPALAFLSLLAASFVLPDSAFVAMAQGTQSSVPVMKNAKPIFTVLRNRAAVSPKTKIAAASSGLPQFNGSFVDSTGKTITYTMIGPDPSTTNTTTVVPVVIIPIKMVYGTLNGNTTFDPLKVTLPNGQTLIQNIEASPIFASNAVDFIQGGVNVGTTQYIDAFQRANFWSRVSTNSSYHVVLGTPTVLPEQTINVSPYYGMVMANSFAAGNVGTMYVTQFDTLVQGFITANKSITPGVLPIFVTDNVFLTQLPLGQECCIGGYHSAVGAQPSGQTYSYATYITTPGSFAQDVSALSHELGEWLDDPFVDNSVNCTDNSLMEVGDPLENNANYGGFPYTVNGFTYNLQSLVFIGYFGAPRSISLNSWLSFQNDESSACPGQTINNNSSATRVSALHLH